MGHVMVNAMHLVGLSKTPRVNARLAQSVDQLTALAARCPQLTHRELLHVKGVQQLADG